MTDDSSQRKRAKKRVGKRKRTGNAREKEQTEQNPSKKTQNNPSRKLPRNPSAPTARQPNDLSPAQDIMSERSGQNNNSTLEEKKGIRGRAHWEQPAFRPILDSDVELFEPASREPVRVSNAFTRMLISQFTLPLVLLVLSALLVAGIYAFLVDQEEKEHTQYAESAEQPGTALNTGTNGKKAYYTSADPASAFSGSSGGLAPASEENCQAAVHLVQRFLKAKTLSDKLRMVQNPERLERLFLERFSANKIGAVPFRKVECMGHTTDDQSTLIVNVTLYNFTNKQFIVHRRQDGLLLEIPRPEDLLE
jgi:hypothetical protein